jgi:hypothetical protein
MDPVAQIQRLGWEWRADGLGQGLGPGVLLSIVIDGRTLRAFVPLEHVWLSFDHELQSVGCVGSAWVGEPFGVGGFFSFIKKAVKSVGKVAKKVVPKAIQRAAARVVATAKHYGGKAWSAIKRVPVLGTLAGAATSLALLPARAASQLVQGKRIDRIAIDNFKHAIKDVRAVAPYVQTVLSVVPGVGQGISAGLGGALALANGQPISEALLAAAKSAVPGGPAAQAAFSVASDVMQGKPVSTVMVNALPVSPQAKRALLQGLGAAKALAEGKNVAQTVIDTAMHQIPPQYQKAVQVGVALGHAKNLQQAGAAAAHGAMSLARDYDGGQHALAQLSRGVRSPALLAAAARAQAAHRTVRTAVQHAQQGHQGARNLVNTLARLRQSRHGVPATPSFGHMMPRFA